MRIHTSIKTCFVLLSLLLLGNLAQADDHAKAEAVDSAAETEATETETTMSDDESSMQSAAAMPTESAATASKFTCALQGLVRRVEIAYATDGTGIPCDVNYYKDSESPGEVSTLWSAQNIEGYCEQKANEFVNKLESWGWSCQPQ